MQKNTLAAIAIVLAVLLLAGGLVFLCAATAQPNRIPLALILLVLGALLAVWGGTTLRKARDLQPERVADRIVELVRRRGTAEITLADAVGSLEVPHQVAEEAFGILLRRQVVERQPSEDRDLFVFHGLREIKAQRQCPYCGSNFSVKTPLHKCPNCGATLEVTRK